MIPHKTKRGIEALNRLKVFEGIPPAYMKTKRMVVPSALRVIKLKPGMKFCRLGPLSHEVGWKHQDVVKTLEEKPKARAALYYGTKKGLERLKATAESEKAAELKRSMKHWDNMVINYKKIMKRILVFKATNCL